MNWWLWMTLEALKAVGSIVTAVGVMIAITQLRRTIRWNKLNATFTLFSNETLIVRETKAAEVLVGTVDLLHQVDPLSEKVVADIIATPALYGPIKGLLNYFEDYAAAVHTGILYEPTAYATMSELLTRYFQVFSPLIQEKQKGKPTIWMEFEKLSGEWKRRLDKDNARIEREEQAENERKRKERERAESKRLRDIQRRGAGPAY